MKEEKIYCRHKMKYVEEGYGNTAIFKCSKCGKFALKDFTDNKIKWLK
jgi:hypothetical protein